MSKIRDISQDVNSLLKSQVNLNSLSDVVREIVQNGIDAHSQKISIIISVNFHDKSINLDYTDDGMGIHPVSLEHFGKRFFTSKLEINSEDRRRGLLVLENVTTFGFRGETMHSLRNLCDTVILVSRIQEYNTGFKVCFNGDDQIGSVVKSQNPVKVGTNIKLIGLFERVCVRKKLLINKLKKSWIKDSFEIRKAVLDALVGNPYTEVNILRKEFRNGIWSKKVLVTTNVKDIANKVPFQPQMKSFNNIFGGNICSDYEICKVKFKDFELKVGIGISTTQSRNYQFVYLNQRPFINEELMKHINAAFQNHYELWGADIKIEAHGKVIRNKSSMYGKPYSVNPIFLACFQTPVDISELIQDPSKACFTSRNEKIFKSLFTKAIEIFFGLFCEKNKEKITVGKVGKVKKITKVSNGSAILKSSTRMSNISKQEISGRFSKSKLEGRYENCVFDFNKIQKRFLKKHLAGNITKECETDINGNGTIVETTASKGCKDHHAPLSQSEITQKSRFFNELAFNEITRENLKHFNIIGQVESKFILVKFGDRIVGLDQHASDERVNLEILFDNILDNAIQQKYDELKNIISLTFVNEYEMDLVKQYKEAIEFWGIKFSFEEEAFSISITHLPAIVPQRIAKDVGILQKGIVEYIYNLEKGSKQIFKAESLAVGFPRRSVNVNQVINMYCPAIIVETAKSRACRGAIMFGDRLSAAEQHDLVARLSLCREPFRCAHGRPSLYPLCVLLGK